MDFGMGPIGAGIGAVGGFGLAQQRTQDMAIAGADEARRAEAFEMQKAALAEQQAAQAAEQQRALAMQADFAALADGLEAGTVGANDFARISLAYPEWAGEIKSAYDAVGQDRRTADTDRLFKAGTAIKMGKPEIAVQMIEDFALAATNSGNQMEADFAKAMAEAIKADPQAGLAGIGAMLHVLDPDAAKAVFGDAPEPTASQKDYGFYVQQETSAGRVPLSFNEWDLQGKKAGASTTTISTGSEVGTIPQGYEMFTDPATGARSLRPIAGGPEDKTAATANAAGADIVATETITTAAARAREAAGNRELGGFGASLAARNPYSSSAEVERQIDVLRANAATTTLQAMRDASPTGSTGLGALTANEMKVIQDKAGALDQNSPTFLRDLDDYERTLLRVIHGPEAGDRIFNATRGGSAAGSGSQSGATDPVAAAADDLSKYGAAP